MLIPEPYINMNYSTVTPTTLALDCTNNILQNSVIYIYQICDGEWYVYWVLDMERKLYWVYQTWRMKHWKWRWLGCGHLLHWRWCNSELWWPGGSTGHGHHWTSSQVVPSQLLCQMLPHSIKTINIFFDCLTDRCFSYFAVGSWSSLQVF